MTLQKFSFRHGDRAAPPQKFPCALCSQQATDGFVYTNREDQPRTLCRRCLSHLRQSITAYDEQNPGPGRTHPPRTLAVD